MGTRHLVQVARSAVGRLHSYVDHNSSERLLQRLRACLRHPTKHRGTTVSPTCANAAFRGMSSTTPMKYYCFPSRYIWHSVLGALQATHKPTIVWLLLPSCLIVGSIAAGLCVEQRHSTGRRLPVNQCGF